ncbi:uncharacterized protein ACNS7B_012852 [Menidia menidia]
MELYCLPTETPTTASSCSTDPLYDNCPPFAQREKAKEKEMESRVVCPLVTRLPGPGSPLPALVPALAEVQTVVAGGRGPGASPGRSYRSCRRALENQPWEAELRPGINNAGGGKGCDWGIGDRARQSQSPSPSQSEEHRSALSLYDNLPDADTTDTLQQDFDMEASFQEHLQDMNEAWAPEQLRGLTWDDAVGHDQSPWSSCQVTQGKSCVSKQDQNQDEDKEPDQEPKMDSGSCGFEMDPELSGSLLASPRQIARCPVLRCPAEAQHPPPPPRVPPPVPLADPSASALRSLLTSLQQQIIRQREEYEARIISLEQRNEELQVEVVRLKTNLTQQRHWYQAVQAKIVESERARDAAEFRNATLQKDMEQFFDTFGELNSEAKKTEYIVKSF